MERSLNVGIFIFSEAEVLDFAGPYEVFSVACRVAERDGDGPVKPFNVAMVSKDGQLVKARHGFNVMPDFSFATCPDLDIVVIAGGVMDEPLADTGVNDWLVKSHQQASLTTSVCTGAFLLAKAGLLDGQTATTHWEDLDELRDYGKVEVIGDVSMVDNGAVITSAGVSSGIEMSLNIVGDLLGQDLAHRTARQMEFPFKYNPRNSRPGSNPNSPQDWRTRVRAKTKAFQQRSDMDLVKNGAG